MNYWDDLVEDYYVMRLMTLDTTVVSGTLVTGKAFILSLGGNTVELAIKESSDEHEARFAQGPLDFEPDARVDYGTYTESFNRLYPAALELLLGTEPDCG